MADIESLELQITGDSKSAKDGLDALIATLDTLKLKTQGGAGLSAIAKPIANIAKASGQLNGSEGAKLKSLADGLNALSNLGNLKLSSSVANQIAAMGKATAGLSGVDFTKLNDLASSVVPLTTLGKSNLGTILGQIKKLPEVVGELGKVDMGAFKKEISELTVALKPLADEMQKVANGFSAFPARIQQFLNSGSKVPTANAKSAFSFANLAAKVTTTMYALKRGASVVASWINKSSEYTENLNLFTVAMGQYANSAMDYANKVSDVMGIDPSEWIRNQGVFMTLATGFGVVGDRAATMSQQLTQLGYDLSSYYNISVEEAMQKLKSGFAGELEPLRNLGYDLSQAKLEAVALSLGIDKSVSSMTQAEKAQLRYHAIMTQVTQVQGDMARTLNDPANQLRILRAQIDQAARALGNIFIPILNKVLPYLIAFAKVVRIVANAIAGLFGFSFPEVDSSGISSAGAGAGDLSENLEDASGNASKLKKTLLGIDELNVMSDPSGGGSGGAGIGGGGFDFELPTYDFIGEATENRVNEIVEEMKKWLGITEDINSWSEFFDTKLGSILITVGLIGLGFASWKIAGVIGKIGSLADGLKKLAPLAQTAKVASSVFLTLAGGILLVTSAFDAFNNGVNWKNLLGMLGGMGLIVGGLAISFGATGAAIGLLVGGIALLVTGIKNAVAGSKSLETALSVITGILAIGGGIAILIGGWVPLAIAGVAAVVSMIVMYWTEIVTWFSKTFKAVGKFFRELWDDIESVWSKAAKWFYTKVVRPVVDFFENLWDSLVDTAVTCWNGIVKVFSPVVNWFGQLFRSVYRTLSDIFYNIGVVASGCWTIIKAVWGIVSQWFNTTVVQPVSKFFANLWTGIRTAAVTAWNGIKSVYTSISTWMNTTIIQPVSKFFSNLWAGFLSGAKSAWSGVKSVFSTVASFFKTTFQNAWAGVVKVFSVASNVFVDIKNAITTAFKSIVNSLIRGINNIIRVPFEAINRALTTIRNIRILGLSPFRNLISISVPQIPYLEAGGLVKNSGQLFVANEAGPELVANVGRKTAVMNNDQIVDSVSRGVYQAVVAAMGSSRGDQVVEAKVNDKVLFEVVVSRARQETVRTGYNPLLGGA